MRESLNIINSCLNLLNILNDLNDYSFISDDKKFVFPNRSFMKYDMESLIHHFKFWTEGFFINKEETYSVVEAPKGELVYI